MILPDFSIDIKAQVLTDLCTRLTEIGYEELAVSKLLGRWDLSEMRGEEHPNYIWRCEQEGSDLSQVVLFFLLSRSAAPQRIAELIGEDVFEALCDSKIILKYKDVVVFMPVLYPCLGRFIFTDQWVSAGAQAEGKIYELGTDSFVLARLTPRSGVKRALDLCTGSGIHAVFSSLSGADTQAVDINPRAKIFTELNARLNGVSCQVHLGDLYAPVSGQTFDLITANPPFVPSPDRDVLIHRSTGESGEEVPERLVAGLPEHLTEGGMFSMVLDHPVYEHQTYLERLESWIGETRGWGIAVLNFNLKTPAAYIVTHIGSPEREDYQQLFEKYLESYKRVGITAMQFAHVFIKRLKEDIPNWKVEQATAWPNVDLASQMEDWLACLTKAHSEAWQPESDWKPRLSQNYTAVWRDWNQERGALQLADDNWIKPEFLNADEAEFLYRIKEGTQTIASLKSDWIGDGRGEDCFEKTLRDLIFKRALA